MLSNHVCKDIYGELQKINNVKKTKGILEKYWKMSELPFDNEIQLYCGLCGKVIEMEESDDTIIIEWENFDNSCIPFKACQVTFYFHKTSYAISQKKKQKNTNKTKQNKVKTENYRNKMKNKKNERK